MEQVSSEEEQAPTVEEQAPTVEEPSWSEEQWREWKRQKRSEIVWPNILVCDWPCRLSRLSSADGTLRGNKWFSSWKDAFEWSANINLRPESGQQGPRLVIKGFNVWRPYEIMLQGTKNGGVEFDPENTPVVFSNKPELAQGPPDQDEEDEEGEIENAEV